MRGEDECAGRLPTIGFRVAVLLVVVGSLAACGPDSSEEDPSIDDETVAACEAAARQVDVDGEIMLTASGPPIPPDRPVILCTVHETSTGSFVHIEIDRDTGKASITGRS